MFFLPSTRLVSKINEHVILPLYSKNNIGYRYGGPGSILSTTRKKLVGLERGPLSLLSTAEEILDRKEAAPV
jgi:hypothetical protein